MTTRGLRYTVFLSSFYLYQALSLSLSLDCHNPLIQNCTSNIHCFWGFSNRFLTLLTWVLRPCAFRGRISSLCGAQQPQGHPNTLQTYKHSDKPSKSQPSKQGSNCGTKQGTTHKRTANRENSQRMPETNRFHEIRINQQTFAAWWSQTCILPSSFGLTIHFHPLASFGVWTARA